MHVMTNDEAFGILSNMDPTSTAPFSEKEREAVISLGARWKMGQLSEEEVKRFLALTKSS